MVVYEQESTDSVLPVGSAAGIHFHRKAAKPGPAMAQSLVKEFRRWMADEIEEIAELVDETAQDGSSQRSVAQIVELADQLADQAEMLGYPHIVEIAERLKQCIDHDLLEAASATGLDEQVRKLRAAIGR